MLGETGGSPTTGGTSATGGTSTTGGTTGKTSLGGSTSTGGTHTVGGSISTTTGGTHTVGGSTPTGGVTSTGGTCPSIGGPVMVQLPLGYCIDSTEVTRAQYLAWLNTSPPTSGQSLECSWNTSFTPSADWPPIDKLNYPVAYVDWCDAYAYCLAVGKRLCGKIGGGPNAYTDFNNAAQSQWFAACSSNGVNRYPYGNTFSAITCNSNETGYLAPLPVGSLPNCQPPPPYSGVYDLSGNIAEWEDSCEGSSKSQYCHLRGGAFCPNLNYKQDSCGRVPYGSNRNNRDKHYGFRCCSL